MKRAALHNLGCKVNAYETEAMQQRLKEAGYQIVPFGEEADVYIINTCTVTNIADRKSRQMLHRAKKQNPQAIVVAVGCYVQASQEACERDEAIDIMVGNNKKYDIVSIIEEFQSNIENNIEKFPSNIEEIQGRKEFPPNCVSKTVIDINHTTEFEDMPITRLENHTRAIIKVQDGCNQFCTYCIIPYVRGRVRSRKLASVFEEVTVLAEQGYKEIVLTGIHLSSYGIDFREEKIENNEENKETLLSFIQHLHEIHGVERIRLGSLEPRIITEEFVAALSRLPKVCPHFHLSLQSGCDSVLKRMNRHYSTQEYLEKCEQLRKFYKNPAITTDVIVGFPGETEEEFAATKKFLEQIHFFEMHIFKYSKRSGTKAALMPDQVPEQVKTERSNQLLQLEKEMSNEYREQLIGQRAEVLLEETVSRNGIFGWIGHTREYVKIVVKWTDGGSEMQDREEEERKKMEAEKRIGQMIWVKVIGTALEEALLGVLE